MKKVNKRSGKRGLPPGSLVHVGEPANERASILVFRYNAERYEEQRPADLKGLGAVPPENTVLWLDIDGLTSDELLMQAGDLFGLHPLLLEDVLNTDHRPKVEEYQNELFVVMKMLSLDTETGSIRSEQICFVLRPGMVISFQERPGEILEPIRERIRKDLGRVRRSGADYLLYTLLDVIVDHYFVIVEDLGQRIEKLERKVLVRPGNEDLATIQELRSMLILVTRFVTPTRELAGRLNTIQGPLIEKATRRYITDLQDHAVYIAETIGTFRELLSSLENAYHAGQNMRMGQVMKFLTIISTIFIPLTFLVGVYGMNFRHMPELEWHFGYFAVWGLMILVALIMLHWFRRKRWL